MPKPKSESFYGPDGKVVRRHSKPKDWSFRAPKEGRAGKPERAKPIKLKAVFIPSQNLLAMVLSNYRFKFSCATPLRPVFSDREMLVLASHLFHNYQDIEVRWNQDHRLIEFQDLSAILSSPSEPASKANEGHAQQLADEKKNKKK